MSLFGKIEPEQITVNGQPLRAMYADINIFGREKLNLTRQPPPFSTWIETNESVMWIVCDNCGYIHWFILHLMK